MPWIDIKKCTGCGSCVEKCPVDTMEFMELCAKHLGDAKEKMRCLDRMIKHFKREKFIAEKTLEELERLK